MEKILLLFDCNNSAYKRENVFTQLSTLQYITYANKQQLYPLIAETQTEEKGEPAGCCGLLNTWGSYMVLAKNTIRLQKNKEESETRLKEGLAGWLRGKCFHLPRSLFPLLPFHPFLFSSCYIYHSFLLSHFLCGIVLSVKSCHDKAVYF